MSYQAASGPFPTQPTGPGSVPGGVPTSGAFPSSAVPPGGGMYSFGSGPPGGMFRMVGPPGMMSMGPHSSPFAAMRPAMAGQPGILPMPPMPPAVMLPMQAPMRPMISAPPHFSPRPPTIQARIPVISPSAMKVATTVFVGNISERSSDTLLRQILLRCGRIEGWKRVQDASGKLQGFGFCEYGDPESTLRAMRILHNFKLGDKNLVVKVDSKTRTGLLKYVLKKKHKSEQETVDDSEIEKEVEEMDEKKGIEILKEVTDETQKEADEQIIAAITALVRENVEVLVDGSRSAADVKLEKDVKEALFAIAKQQGKVDPNSTLDDMDMEDDMKTLVSDEIKKFRQSSERQAVEKHKLRERQRERRKTDVDSAPGDGSPAPNSPREREEKRGRGRSPHREKERERSPLQRPRTPVKRRSRTPSPRTRAREKQEREALRKEKEREESLKEEESYESRMQQRKQRIRERAYKERLSMWESRERRKAKDYNKDLEKEEQRKEEMEREGRDLGEFLEDYDDGKDDQRYYKGGQFARRRRERELEKEEDEKDRQREKEEIEALRLEVMERQVKEWQREQGGNDVCGGSTGSSSPQRSQDDDEDEEEVPKVEMEEDIPLAKTGFSLLPAFPPIQVQSAPDVEHPELKSHPRDTSEGDGITIQSGDDGREGQWTSDGVGDAEEDMDIDSPHAGVKMSFGVWSKPGGNGSNSTPTRKRAMDTNVLGGEDEGESDAPKKKLASIKQIEREQRDEKALEREVTRMALKYSGEDRKKIPPEERKKMIQTLVKEIPTSKEELFDYELKWEAIDQNLMEKRIGPWINKKIVEYIGEEELTLTDFICNKLATHIPASTILEELAMVLDEEAEVFVVKLWRLLIYETEAKYLGIAKSY